VDDFITFEPLHKEQIKQIVVLTAQVSRARLWVCGKMRWQRKICKE
jgi:ATP-dependent Clp protease ATP-binding subunit ClpA